MEYREGGEQRVPTGQLGGSLMWRFGMNVDVVRQEIYRRRFGRSCFQ